MVLQWARCRPAEYIDGTSARLYRASDPLVVCRVTGTGPMLRRLR
jgi:hypothetical protein